MGVGFRGRWGAESGWLIDPAGSKGHRNNLAFLRTGAQLLVNPVATPDIAVVLWTQPDDRTVFMIEALALPVALRKLYALPCAGTARYSYR